MRPLPNTNPSHTAIELEHIARDCKSSSQARRLRAIAMVMLGAERSEAARAQAVDTQSLRDWIVLYNEGGVDGLRPARRGGRRCRLSASPLEMVAGWIDAGPEVGEDVPSRFRLRDIAERIAAVFSVLYSLQGVRKLLRRLGFRHIPARPLHPKADLAAQEDFRRNFSQLAATAADGAGPIEIWFQDEARAASKECFRGSGPARAPGHGSRATADSGTATSSPLHAQNASAPSGMSAAAQILSK